MGQPSALRFQPAPAGNRGALTDVLTEIAETAWESVELEGVFERVATATGRWIPFVRPRARPAATLTDARPSEVGPRRAAQFRPAWPGYPIATFTGDTVRQRSPIGRAFVELTISMRIEEPIVPSGLSAVLLRGAMRALADARLARGRRPVPMDSPVTGLAHGRRGGRVLRP